MKRVGQELPAELRRQPVPPVLGHGHGDVAAQQRLPGGALTRAMVSLEGMEIRSASDADAEAVQRLKKHAWRACYAHPETGVTQSVLENELAVNASD